MPAFEEYPTVDRRNHVLDNVLEAMGETPCIRLNRVPRNHGIQCEVIAKCEFLSPGGSVKDRVCRRMVKYAEEEGRLKQGDKVVEATSGNTGIGLSVACAVRGYNCTIAMPTKMSHEKSTVLEALGSRVIRTPMVPHDHPDSLISLAKRLEKDEGYVFLDQYRNPGNPDAHYYETANEILRQCGTNIDMVVIGAGTGGTITGIAKRLKEVVPGIVVVGVDPYGSILADPSKPCENVAYQVEGIGYDFVPEVCKREYVDVWVKSADKESFELAREIHRLEGMLVGGSCGSAMWGVLQAAKDLRPDQRCVVVFPDNIRNYLTKFVDDNWLIERGLLQGEVKRPTYDALKAENDSLKAELAKLKQ